MTIWTVSEFLGIFYRKFERQNCIKDFVSRNEDRKNFHEQKKKIGQNFEILVIFLNKNPFQF